MKRRLNFQSRRFFAFTQTNDDLQGYGSRLEVILPQQIGYRSQDARTGWISSIEIDKGTTVNSATFKLVPISRETFWGDAGSCTLDYLSEGYIQWTITVPGAVIVSFEGNLHFNKLGTPFGTFDHAISAYGTIGTEDVKYGLSKGKWEVEFTGIATAANGDMYSVVDGATLAFSVTK